MRIDPLGEKRDFSSLPYYEGSTRKRKDVGTFSRRRRAPGRRIWKGSCCISQRKKKKNKFKLLSIDLASIWWATTCWWSSITAVNIKNSFHQWLLVSILLLLCVSFQLPLEKERKEKPGRRCCASLLKLWCLYVAQYLTIVVPCLPSSPLLILVALFFSYFEPPDRVWMVWNLRKTIHTDHQAAQQAEFIMSQKKKKKGRTKQRHFQIPLPADELNRNLNSSKVSHLFLRWQSLLRWTTLPRWRPSTAAAITSCYPFCDDIQRADECLSRRAFSPLIVCRHFVDDEIVIHVAVAP